MDKRDEAGIPIAQGQPTPHLVAPSGARRDYSGRNRNRCAIEFVAGADVIAFGNRHGPEGST